jgi:Protein of unknown function (DUF3134)
LEDRFLELMIMMNPSLKEEPRSKTASILASGQQVSILDWLDSTGRLVARDTVASFEYREDVEELQELMVSDEGGGGFVEEEEEEDDSSSDDSDDD